MLSELYFINSKELSKKLAEESISEKLAFMHFLVGTIIGGSVFYVPIDMQWAGEEPSSTLLQALTIVIMGIIQYWGFSRAYKVNEIIDNKNFFLRLAALSLPILIQTIIYSIFIVAVFGIVVGNLPETSKVVENATMWLYTETALGALLTMLYFKLLLSAFNKIKEYKSSEIM